MQPPQPMTSHAQQMFDALIQHIEPDLMLEQPLAISDDKCFRGL